MIKIYSILFVLIFNTALFCSVIINQEGYLPQSEKFVFVTTQTDSFFVQDINSGNIVFRGELSAWTIVDEMTGLTLYKGNFSAFRETGRYFITTSLGERSYEFDISENVYENVYKASLKGFYYWRCGSLLAGANAGIYYHAACHTTDGFYHTSTGLSGFRLVTGGWHDAGDYGKYIVNAGVTVGTMLLAYEIFPDRFSNDDLNIPESNNNIPDILDENKYEMDWFLKMQNIDGGVFCKVTKNDFEGFIMPNNDSGMRNIHVVSSTATGDFAAVLAKASRIYTNFDTSYSNKCITAAELAWSFLEAHTSIVPAGGFKNPSDTHTGEYGDADDRDERLWAASELFLTTGKDKYHNYFKSHYSEAGLFTGAMSWGNVRTLALLTYLLSDNANTDNNIKNTLKDALKSYCDKLVTRKNSSGFHLTLTSNEFNWGCNSDVLNKAIMLIAGYQLTNEINYYNTALDQLNYILGCNAHNISFVTGTGTSSVMHPHHRPSEADKIAAPVPGLLAGGPNKYLSDDVLKARFNSSTPPALCYIDDLGSYASNEVAINWNSPLVFVAGYFNAEGKPTEIGKLEEMIPTKIQLKQNYPNPFNGSTIIRFYLPNEERITINIFDSLGNIVQTRDLGLCSRGNNFYSWNSKDKYGNQLSTGIYFYQISGELHAISKKMMLLK